MRSLALKLSLLFMAIALLAVGIVAIWINNSVHVEFSNYCQRCQCREGETCAPSSVTYGGRQIVSAMGDAEKAFLKSFQDALWLAALVAVSVAIALALLISRLTTAPLKQVTFAAEKVAAGDFSQRVATRTNDEVGQLSNAFNSMAQQLEKKEQSRRQLLADIAHELRTPLSVIQGNMEAWLDGVIKPTPQQITSVHDETVLLSRIITDLRDLSLAEAGQLKLHQAPARLEKLISSELSHIESRALEQKVSLHYQPISDLPQAFMDTDRIRQVLRNLLGNALRYTPANGAINIVAKHSPTGWITVAVSDTGSGIDPEDLDHIFDHFYKADKSRQRGHGSSGLGLAIVKQLVEAHGGKVWAEGQPRKGSTFYFTLPTI